jgi:hypothetical protein
MRLLILIPLLGLFLVSCQQNTPVYTITTTNTNKDGTVDYVLNDEDNNKAILRSKPKDNFKVGTKIKFE